MLNSNFLNKVALMWGMTVGLMITVSVATLGAYRIGLPPWAIVILSCAVFLLGVVGAAFLSLFEAVAPSITDFNWFLRRCIVYVFVGIVMPLFVLTLLVVKMIPFGKNDTNVAERACDYLLHATR